jgi:hypothetical protein
MAIGADQRLGRLLAHGPKNLLPASWRTLFELTKLSDEQFALALEQNLICADMERYVIDHIRQGVYSPKPEPTTSAPEPVTLRTNTTSSTYRLDDPALRTWREHTPPADNVVPLPLDPPHRTINHFEVMKAAWDAAPEADRDAFLNYIGVRRIN